MSTDYPNDYEPQDSEVNLDEQSIFSESAIKDLNEESYEQDNEQHVENIDSESYDNQYSEQPLTDVELADDEADPEYSAVDISILDKNYTINCPVGEEHELFSASDFINNFIEDLRAQAPQLPHENLLVLCCLNLYEKLQQSQNSAAANEQSIEQANQLIEQMIHDMQLVQ